MKYGIGASKQNGKPKNLINIYYEGHVKINPHYLEKSSVCQN